MKATARQDDKTAGSAFETSGVWVGFAAVVLIPVAYLDGIYRFALLPQVLALLGVSLWGVGAWLWNGGATWKRSPLVLPLAAFLLAEAISLFASTNRVASLLPITVHAGFAFFLLVLLNGLKPDVFRRVLKTAGGVSAVLSVLGVAQYMGWGREWIPTAGLPSATFGHRNIAAAYLVGMLPLVFWAWAGAKQMRGMLLWGVALGLDGAFLAATRSRGAWIGLGGALLGAALMAVWRRRGKVAGDSDSCDMAGRTGVLPRAASLGVALALTVALAVVPADIGKGEGEAMWEGKRSVGEALSSVIEAGGDKGRLTLWHRTLEIILSRPIMGVGAGNWRLVYPAYAQGDMVDRHTVPHRPHNDLLWIWAETGTIGLGFYLYLLWTAARMGFRLFCSGRNRLLAGALLCSMLAAVVNSLFSFPREFPSAWMPFYLSLAGIGVLDRPSQHSRRGSFLAVLCGGAVLLALGIWVTARQIGFDRHALALRLADAESRWQDVIREGDRALAWGTFDEEVYLIRGRAYAALGAFPKALGDYRLGLAYHPNSAGLWNGLGNALRAVGKRDEAFDAYRRALELNPGWGAVYSNIGTLYATSGALDSALVAYQRAVTLQSDLADSYANLSLVYRKMGDLPRALDAANLALKRDPYNLEGLNALGNACLTAEYFDAAASAFARALSVDSSRVEVYYNLGRAHDCRGDSRRAIAAYEAFLGRWEGGDNPYVQVARRRIEVLKTGSNR